MLRVLPMIIGSAAALQIEAEAETGAAMDESYDDHHYHESEHNHVPEQVGWNVMTHLYNAHWYLKHLKELDGQLDGAEKNLEKANKKLAKAQKKQEKAAQNIAARQTKLEKIKESEHKLATTFDDSMNNLHKKREKTYNQLDKWQRKEEKASELIARRLIEVERANKANGIAAFVVHSIEDAHKALKKGCKDVKDLFEEVQALPGQEHLCHVFLDALHQYIGADVCENIPHDPCGQHHP